MMPMPSRIAFLHAVDCFGIDHHALCHGGARDAAALSGQAEVCAQRGKLLRENGR